MTETANLEWDTGWLPTNTSGGGMSEAYVHGFNLVIEGVRQLRGTSTSQVDGARDVPRHVRRGRADERHRPASGVSAAMGEPKEPLDVRIDWDRCMGSGNCVFWAPDTFDLSDDGHAVVLDAAATDEERLRIAAQGCPVGAISLWRDGVERVARGGGVVPIAVTEEHESLRLTAQRWLADTLPTGGAAGRGGGPGAGDGPAASVGEDGGPGVARAPPARGRRWAGLHTGRARRRARGAGPRALSRPRSSRPCSCSAALARARRTAAVRAALLPGLADGSITAAVALGAQPA